ncbi:MAG: VOC family protein [Proteobacteria bacterium]|nr:VOC family protein [Pseudomonadota bacterium]
MKATEQGGFKLQIENVNHIGIRVGDKQRSIDFYTLLGFELITDVGFESGHPVIMKHASGVVVNLLGPATVTENSNILMDVDEKYTGITHFALTVSSMQHARGFVDEHDIKITGSFSFGKMSAIFIRDPDRNVIELDAYGPDDCDADGYEHHP